MKQIARALLTMLLLLATGQQFVLADEFVNESGDARPSMQAEYYGVRFNAGIKVASDRKDMSNDKF